MGTLLQFFLNCQLGQRLDKSYQVMSQGFRKNQAIFREALNENTPITYYLLPITYSKLKFFVHKKL
jgi:hypothetical protein